MMEQKTFLRELRDRHGIPLSALKAVSGLSAQYISSAELRQIRPTKHLEQQMENAVAQLIIERGKALAALERDYQLWKGGLLLPYKG